MDDYSFLNSTDPDVIESLYQQFLIDRNSVDKGWQAFFMGFDLAQKNYIVLGKSQATSDEFKVVNLISDYYQNKPGKEKANLSSHPRY